MHTNSNAAFARSGRLTTEDMDLGTESRNLWLVVTDNDELRAKLTATALRHIIYRIRRENDRSDPLETISRIIVTMAAVGYPESTIDLILLHLQSVKVRCYTGNAHRSLDELDIEESKLEALENELVLHRRIAGDTITADQLEREAVCNELEATLQIERAKELRRVARANTRVLEFRRPFTRPLSGATHS